MVYKNSDINFCHLWFVKVGILALPATSTACCWAGIWKTSSPATRPGFEKWTWNYSKLSL